MMRHQTILHRKWWGAHARCCCRFSRLYNNSTEQREREGAVQYTICMNDLHRNWRNFPFQKRNVYPHRRGYRKPANEPPALNVHNITTLYYYDDYYTSCIMYNCQNVPFHFFRKNFQQRQGKNIRETSEKCNLTIFSAPCSSYDITHTALVRI